MIATSIWRVGATTSAITLLDACQDAAAPSSTTTTFDSQRVAAGMRVVQSIATAPGVSSLQPIARRGGRVTATTSINTSIHTLPSGITTETQRFAQAALTLKYDTTSPALSPTARTVSSSPSPRRPPDRAPEAVS